MKKVARRMSVLAEAIERRCMPMLVAVLMRAAVSLLVSMVLSEDSELDESKEESLLVLRRCFLVFWRASFLCLACRLRCEREGLLEEADEDDEEGGELSSSSGVVGVVATYVGVGGDRFGLVLVVVLPMGVMGWGVLFGVFMVLGVCLM